MASMFALMLFLAPAQDGVPAVPAGVVDVETPLVVDAEGPSGQLAPAPIGVIPEASPKNAMALVDGMKGAIERKDYTAAAAFLLMGVIWLLRQLLKDRSFISQRPDLIPWITLALSCSTGACLSLGTGVALGESLLAGGLIGLSASGGWSLIGKHVGPLKQKLINRLTKKQDKPNALAPIASEAPKEKT